MAGRRFSGGSPDAASRAASASIGSSGIRRAGFEQRGPRSAGPLLAPCERQHRADQRARLCPASLSFLRSSLAWPGLRSEPTRNASSSSPGLTANSRQEAFVLGKCIKKGHRPAGDRAEHGCARPRADAIADGDRTPVPRSMPGRPPPLPARRRAENEPSDRDRRPGDASFVRSAGSTAAAGIPPGGSPARAPSARDHPDPGRSSPDRATPADREPRVRADRPSALGRSLDHCAASSRTTERSWRSISSRWAVSRHQASGSASSVTSSCRRGLAQLGPRPPF